MTRRLPAALLAAAFAVSAAAAGAATPDPKMGDGGVSDFYVWNESLPAGPGKMLRTEPLPEKLVLANAGQGLRILYTSTDGLDGQSPVYVSGALFLPKGEAPEGGWPLLAWAHGTVGVADVCAPSWAGRSERDVTYLNHWLEQGYAVVASDYQGLGAPGGHPYLATRPAAYSVLDSIRAVQGADLNLSKQVVLIGQSQGGGAAFATAAYATAYAPDLDIRGTVATGTPHFSPEVQAQTLATRPRDEVQPTFGYTLLMLYLVKQTDPSFRFEDYLTEPAMRTIGVGASQCIGKVFESTMAERLSLNTAFKVDPTPLLTRVYGLMSYPTVKIDHPVFMGTGGQDRDVPPPMQEALVRDACAAGTRVEWRLYPELDHSGAVNGSRQDSTPFVSRAFAGETIDGNCAQPAG
ncbi:MAG: lipase family protein [Phenylobacterium sp.]|jgi:pimeloyl-ACP methyl ester carboxylesterase|uniref:alpha/beta fold hydrolase n=1 Tax=Phenylobacterium sp. TaxID=1871053 RepID=UPI002A2B6B76|nr:lipase family protein [Phenylobacterium sp.]MDD3836265.1 alpha/beta fold hydrolase [Phenylobacterium sp.]MDX9997955.1 alpha/beta fold hydrolase [Phenylobacterium sp.]